MGWRLPKCPLLQARRGICRSREDQASPQRCFWNILVTHVITSFHSVASLFILTVAFDEQKFFILMKSNLPIFLLWLLLMSQEIFAYCKVLKLVSYVFL